MIPVKKARVGGTDTCLLPAREPRYTTSRCSTRYWGQYYSTRRVAGAIRRPYGDHTAAQTPPNVLDLRYPQISSVLHVRVKLRYDSRAATAEEISCKLSGLTSAAAPFPHHFPRQVALAHALPLCLTSLSLTSHTLTRTQQPPSLCEFLARDRRRFLSPPPLPNRYCWCHISFIFILFV